MRSSSCRRWRTSWLRQGDGGTAAIESGPPVAPETVRRLACDAQTLLIAEGDEGSPVGIGRRSRVVPASMLRLPRQRDTGCRFPGCTSTRTRWIQAHHKRHRADGGRTDTDNLLLLCGAHHRFVHEGRVRIEGVPDGELAFFDRHGRPLVPGPRGLHPKVRRRMEVFIPRLPDWLAPAWLEPPPPWVRRAVEAFRNRMDQWPKRGSTRARKPSVRRKLTPWPRCSWS